MKKIAIILGLALFVFACGKKSKPVDTDSAVKGAPFDSKLAEMGKKNFETICAPCHGKTGKGDGPAGKTLKPKPRNFVSEKFKYGESIAAVKKIISEGAESQGGSSLMRGYKDLFKSEEIDAVANFVLKLKYSK